MRIEKYDEKKRLILGRVGVGDLFEINNSLHIKIDDHGQSGVLRCLSIKDMTFVHFSTSDTVTLVEIVHSKSVVIYKKKGE